MAALVYRKCQQLKQFACNILGYPPPKRLGPHCADSPFRPRKSQHRKPQTASSILDSHYPSSGFRSSYSHSSSESLSFRSSSSSLSSLSSRPFPPSSAEPSPIEPIPPSESRSSSAPTNRTGRVRGRKDPTDVLVDALDALRIDTIPQIAAHKWIRSTSLAQTPARMGRRLRFRPKNIRRPVVRPLSLNAFQAPYPPCADSTNRRSVRTCSSARKADRRESMRVWLAAWRKYQLEVEAMTEEKQVAKKVGMVLVLRSLLTELASQYEERWRLLAVDPTHRLEFDEIPWPIFSSPQCPYELNRQITHQNVATFILSEFRMDIRDKTTARGRARAELMKWHPDKFEPRLIAAVSDEHRTVVVKAVRKVAQILVDICNAEDATRDIPELVAMARRKL